MLRARITKRANTSFARGVTIDGFLSNDDEKALYERWDEDAFGPKNYVQGGESYLTCEQVVAVPVDKLVSTFGKRRASRILEAAHKHAELV